MNIACFNPDLAHFHRDRKSKCRGKRNKGQPKAECLEKLFCPKDISTEEYNRLLSTVSYKVNPICFNLLRIDWAIFGTLTFNTLSYREDNPQKEQKRFNCFYSLNRRTCKLLNLKEKEIEYFVVSERGKSCECHLHFLIGKTGLQEVSVDKICLTMESLWQKTTQFRGNGILLNRTQWGAGGKRQIVPFDQKRKFEGVAYVCKKEFDDFGNEYFKVYHPSIALTKHLTEITSALEKPPPISSSQSKSIIKYFCSVSVSPKATSDFNGVDRVSRFLAKERVGRIKRDRTCFKNRDPPMGFRMPKDGCSLYEKFRLSHF